MKKINFLIKFICFSLVFSTGASVFGMFNVKSIKKNEESRLKRRIVKYAKRIGLLKNPAFDTYNFRQFAINIRKRADKKLRALIEEINKLRSQKTELKIELFEQLIREKIKLKGLIASIEKCERRLESLQEIDSEIIEMINERNGFSQNGCYWAPEFLNTFKRITKKSPNRLKIGEVYECELDLERLPKNLKLVRVCRADKDTFIVHLPVHKQKTNQCVSNSEYYSGCYARGKSFLDYMKVVSDEERSGDCIENVLNRVKKKRGVKSEIDFVSLSELKECFRGFFVQRSKVNNCKIFRSYMETVFLDAQYGKHRNIEEKIRCHIDKECNGSFSMDPAFRLKVSRVPQSVVFLLPVNRTMDHAVSGRIEFIKCGFGEYGNKKFLFISDSLGMSEKKMKKHMKRLLAFVKAMTE